MAETVPIKLPKLSLAMSEATVIEWLVNDGDTVSEGQKIYSVESDKLEIEVEAPATGVLHRSAVAGETYLVGQELGWIDVN
jgi:pyruvate/2-oxoglutarate dehydrogenase complex dihydrolipoamide acyltransferase (E2) component